MASSLIVRNYGWLNQKGGENRLNVAITRAKKNVLIVTSFDANELQVEDAKNDGPRILKKYLLYAQAINDGDKAAAQNILLSFGDAERRADNVAFDSDFENQVYDELSKCGYQVETQVGIRQQPDCEAGTYNAVTLVSEGHLFLIELPVE